LEKAKLSCIFNYIKIKTFMRKVIAILVIATLTACGGSTSTSPKQANDSSTARYDTVQSTIDTTSPAAKDRIAQ
jgi:uncharacterized lipoprotein